ncbi:MAG: ABC transporter ATP-binding protein, partial [Pseudomonadota bacterium]
ADTTQRVTVMYDGRVMESGPTAQVLGRPSHAYSQALIAAVPRPTVRLARFPRVSYGGRGGDIRIADLAATWPDARVTGETLLSVTGLTKRFVTKPALLPRNRSYLTAVKDASFDIARGEVFGLVGESGSGKSTVARMIAGLMRVDGGHVAFEGGDVTARGQRLPESFRRQIQMIFQDPFSSLNPRMRVDRIVAEPARFLGGLRGADLSARVDTLLDAVGLGADAGLKYPHEFSGGQRQRIAIARALATQPRFLICDEPTSALDVSIQAQILNILKDLQEHLGLTMLFISHDLPVVRQMCDRVGVMRAGEIVELADTDTLFAHPRDPYTKRLLDLMPRLEGVSTEGLAATGSG